MSEYSDDDERQKNYHKWLRINAFMRELHQQHYMYRLAEELDHYDEIDMIVAPVATDWPGLIFLDSLYQMIYDVRQ